MGVSKADWSHREHGKGRQMSQPSNLARTEWMQVAVGFKKEYMVFLTVPDFAKLVNHERLVTGLNQRMCHVLLWNCFKITLYYL